MNPWVRLGLRIASLPIFDVKKNYSLIRKAQENIAQRDMEEFQEEHPEYQLIDHYLLTDDSQYSVPIRIFPPTDARTSNIIIFFHGGGFVTGNVDTYTRACREITEASNTVLFSVDYRKAPEHPYPAGLSDCYKVALEIVRHFIDTGKRKIFIMGDSAGGNLATVVTRLLMELEEIKVDGEILIYPTMGYDYSVEFAKTMVFPSLQEKGYDFGLTLQNMRNYYDLYLENQSLMKTDENVTPLISDKLNLLPRTLIVTAEHDPLLDEAKAYAHRLEENQVETTYRMISEVPHGFLTRSTLFPEAHTELMELLQDFLEDKHVR